MFISVTLLAFKRVDVCVCNVAFIDVMSCLEYDPVKGIAGRHNYVSFLLMEPLGGGFGVVSQVLVYTTCANQGTMDDPGSVI